MGKGTGMGRDGKARVGESKGMEEGRGKGKWEGRDRAWDGEGKGGRGGKGRRGAIQPTPQLLFLAPPLPISIQTQHANFRYANRFDRTTFQDQRTSEVHDFLSQS